jgi:LuxR family transcriptional regulator of spore coat protein
MSGVIDCEPMVGLLSAREQEVLEAIASGLSAKEVARALILSPRTVERHIENIRIKLHAKNTAHLIARAYSIGALRPI